MAYVYSGSMMNTNVNKPPYSSGDVKTVTSTSIFLNKGYGLYATVKNINDEFDRKLYKFPRHNIVDHNKFN